MTAMKEGKEMHALASRLFPICRSLTGNGVRQTLKMLQKHIPLRIREVPSGTKVFDWTVPPEWNIRDAYVANEQGDRVIDFKKNNLHVVGYSMPVDTVMSLSELQKHLHSLPEMPDAIPYVTSYYKKAWGFCLKHKDRLKLKEGKYRVVIDSTLSAGHLTYGELLIKGKRKEEIFLSTYICHPSLANNELSGPVVTTALARWLGSAPRRYSYRIIFVPETIGSITYLSRNLEQMRARTIAGFNLTCCGDERTYSFVPSRYGTTLADKVSLRVLSQMHPNFKRYDFLDRESDERQYCSALADLPLVSIMRSKYHAYPEYHTSLDDLTVITPAGLQGTYDVYTKCISILEQKRRYRATVVGEPQLGKRGLYKTDDRSNTAADTRLLLDVLVYADGMNDVHDLALLTRRGEKDVAAAIKILHREKLITEC